MKELNNGWTLDYKFLKNLTHKINEQEWGEGLSMEQVECVLLAVNYNTPPLSTGSLEELEKLVIEKSVRPSREFITPLDTWNFLKPHLIALIADKNDKIMQQEVVYNALGAGVKSMEETLAKYLKRINELELEVESLSGGREEAIKDFKDGVPDEKKMWYNYYGTQIMGMGKDSYVHSASAYIMAKMAEEETQNYLQSKEKTNKENV